ncbi:hypothetical protein C8T65DRAFT_551386, partial [Cerioporus squamosus]
GEMEHIHVGIWYKQTNKVQHTGQIARHTDHAEKLRTIKGRVDEWRGELKKDLAKGASGQHGDESSNDGRQDSPQKSDSQQDDRDADDETKLAYSSPAERYHIAKSQRHHDNIFNWVSSFHDDPALKDYYLDLKNHLLARLEDCGLLVAEGPQPGEFSFQQQSRLLIWKEAAFWHEVLRLNYTTYDLRRSQDSVNPKNHGDIMLLADDSNEPGAHPYVYARIIRIFHVNVRLDDSPMQDFERFDVLFVRWFRLDHSAPGGFEKKRLHRLEFVPADGEQPAFGFVNPADVVRGTHIVPAYAFHPTSILLGPSMARDVAGKLEGRSRADMDYRYHYVNLYVI